MPHNGGTTQVNVWFPQIDGCFPWMNLFKWGQSWNYVTPGDALYDPTKHDINGYMHTVYKDGVYNRFFIPSQASRPGDYVLKWDGSGTLSIGGAQTTATNGRVVYTTPSATVDVYVHDVGTPGGGAGDYPTNIRFCHEDDEALLDADPYALGVNFKTIMVNAKVGSIRLLDWINTNTSNLCHWADRTPLDYYCWASYQQQTIPFSGQTTNSGDDYSITIADFVLTDKKQIIVEWNATSTGLLPRLNVSSGGLIPVVAEGVFNFSSGTKPTISTQRLLTYDADLGCWMMSSGRPGIQPNLPMEMIVKLCEEIGCHPWIPVPYLALDPHTDLVVEMATYLKDELPGFIPRYEPSNEVWNTNFNATRYGWMKEGARNFNWVGPWVTSTVYVADDVVCQNNNAYKCLVGHTAGTFATDLSAAKWAQISDINNLYGRWASQLGQAVCGVYGDLTPDPTSYWIVNSFFSQRGSALGQVARLTSPTYVSETDAGKAAYLWCTHGSMACYWSSDYIGTASETAWAAEYGTATDARKAVIWEEYFAITGPVSDQSWDNRSNAASEFAEFFDSYDMGFTGYEGGLHSRKTEGGSVGEPLLAFRQAADQAAIHHRLVHRNYALWESVGGEFFPQYVLAGTGDWAIFNPDMYATPTAQWEGISSWSNGRRRYRFKARTAPFAVTDLFDGAITGAWYDFSDTANCFSDDGVTPITNGGGVYRINDKSGNGNHISQATAGSRPTWATGGYATFDGTADHLFMSSSLDSYNKTACAVFVLVKANPGLAKYLIAEGSSSSDNPIYALMLSNNTTASSSGGFIRNSTPTTIFASNTVFNTAVFDNTKRAVGIVDNGTGTNSLRPYRDMRPWPTTNITRSGTLATDRFAIGALVRASAANFFAMDLYQVIILHKVPTYDEIQNIKAYFATK